MTPREVFWDTFARVAGWGLGLLVPLAAAALFLIVVGGTLKRFGFGKRHGGDPKSN